MNNKISIAVSAVLLLAACTKPNDELITTPQNQVAVQSTAISTITPNAFEKKWAFDDSDPLFGLILEKATKLNSSGTEITGTTDNSSIVVTNDPSGGTNKVLKCVIPDSACRAEVSLVNSVNRLIYAYKGSPSNIASNTNLGNEVWIKARVYVPANLTTQSRRNPGANLNTCLVQIGPISKPGTSGSNGFFQLRATPATTGSTNNNSDWKAFYSSTYNVPSFAGSYSQSVATIPIGQWVTYVLHCKFGNFNGNATEKKDSVEVKYYYGSNITHKYCYQEIAQDVTSVRIKWGLYIGMGNPSNRAITCFFDDVVVKSGPSDFTTMSLK